MKRKIVDYEIFRDNSEYDSVYNVRIGIKTGWQPYGPLIVKRDVDTNQLIYIQAMVKYEEDEND